MTDAELEEIANLAHAAHELSAERRLADPEFTYSYMLGNAEAEDIVRVSSNYPKDVHFLHLARTKMLQLIEEVKKLRASAKSEKP